MKIQKIKTNYSRGITLIALVITIIVLLILAGVTISALSGDNGILTNASKSKIETEESSEEELSRLASLEAATNVEGTTHKDSSTGTEKTVEIPAGFAVSKKEGENTIADGLVIIDRNGNEFVWIPVNQENFETEFVRRPGYSSGSIQTSIFETYCGEADSTGNNTDSRIQESETTQSESQKMYVSVEKNGGFYIGRYEAGKENGEAVVKKDQL